MLKYSPLEIKNIRKKFQLNQEDFGNMLGVGLKTVSNWEKGISEISDSCQLLLKLKAEKDLKEHTVNEEMINYEKKTVESILAAEVEKKMIKQFELIQDMINLIIIQNEKIIKILEKVSKINT